MWRIFIFSSLSICFSVVLADSTCSNATSPISPFLFADDILMKLQMELNSMKMSDEVQRLRLETMSLRLEQQTQLLSQISSKLGNNSGSNGSCGCSNVNANSSCSCSAITALFSAQPFLAYCNVEEQKGWTVIQRRVDDSVDFYRDWASYKAGFGDPDGNFYIGNDKLHAMTTAASNELVIILTDFDNTTKIAKYDSFAIGNETEFYALKDLGSYSGDAGDSFTYHKGMKFSTKDQDNDVYTDNCAMMYKGAWWFKDCYWSHLNGVYLKGTDQNNNYGQGITWFVWHGDYYSLKTVTMMIRPKRN